MHKWINLLTADFLQADISYSQNHIITDNLLNMLCFMANSTLYTSYNYRWKSYFFNLNRF